MFQDGGSVTGKVPVARRKVVFIMLMIMASVTRTFKSRRNPIEEDESTKEKEANRQILEKPGDLHVT